MLIPIVISIIAKILVKVRLLSSLTHPVAKSAATTAPTAVGPKDFPVDKPGTGEAKDRHDSCRCYHCHARCDGVFLVHSQQKT